MTAHFAGRVMHTAGMWFEIGTVCDIAVDLIGDGKTGSIDKVIVRCGGKMIYPVVDELEGISMKSAGFAELAGKDPGTLVYAVKFSDTGARTGPRSQIRLDSSHRVAVVFREDLPSFSIEMSVPETSAPVKGERLKAEETDGKDR